MTLPAIKGNRKHWFIRYKLYHLPLWFVYHYVWWTVNIGSPLAAANNIVDSPYAVKFFFYVILEAAGVYFNLYYLIPRFLEKGRYVVYLILLFLTIVLTAALIVPGYYASAWWSGKSIMELYGIEPKNYFYFFQLNTFPSAVATMTLAMSFKLCKQWIQSRQREQLLEKEKLATELKFLKSQFNPHFLFNTINSIFVLIHKNPNTAAASLAKFSELLRYQLYECNEHHIQLRQELEYLDNFMELEKLRQESGMQITVNIDKSMVTDTFIAPFLLMPFIENAFKHVSREKSGMNWIRIVLNRHENDLCLNVSNSTSTNNALTPEPLQYNGIGLNNVRRRLDLLYPQQHQLKINKEDGRFDIELRLKIFSNHQSSFLQTA
ncbi:MAG TPA: histidine kinase [Flavitalea sp.]|nr:histidine kinase [Flavitalea sp.]